ncbi:hypothetical protein CYMTET_19500 [Cymbomonas tetramitiformis]|uniref:UBZ3-type domain-containing protein n=1 Tax=Cymbomonas tetramitiformis TaxID=36881 RepID=A0AAE0L4T8_9CHLO|nr:hypothetical protein CYMTET_19500 [Cymbomonas tetramitiformis]
MADGSGEAGKVLHGTCGWSDSSIVKCGRFYPSGVKTAEERLETYSAHFPCVEVDSSCYAIPSADTTARWVKRTPHGFRFHFKAFGLFCSGSVAANTLPQRVRQMLPPSLGPGDRAAFSELSAEAKRMLWQHFHEALEPVSRGGRMGVVLFQFHLSFAPTEANRGHVLYCRQQLDAKYAMAVEFRNRSWICEPHASSTFSWMRAHNLGLVAADELLHETMQPDRQQRGLPAGEVRQRMALRLEATNQPQSLYVRVHRRHGTKERLLSEEEVQQWAAELRQALGSLSGPCFFLWGTDWEDAPVVNAGRLDHAMGAPFVYDWRSRRRALAGGAHKSSLHNFLQRPAAITQQAPRTQGEHDSAGGARDPEAAADMLRGQLASPTEKPIPREQAPGSSETAACPRGSLRGWLKSDQEVGTSAQQTLGSPPEPSPAVAPAASAGRPPGGVGATAQSKSPDLDSRVRSTEEWWCEECALWVASSREEHADYHFALQLQGGGAACGESRQEDASRPINMESDIQRTADKPLEGSSRPHAGLKRPRPGSVGSMPHGGSGMQEKQSHRWSPGDESTAARGMPPAQKELRKSKGCSKRNSRDAQTRTLAAFFGARIAKPDEPE